MKRFVMCVAALIVLCTVSTSSFAKLTIKPGISVQEKFNDNLFLSKTDRENDFITYIKPNLLIAYAPNSSLDMGLHYGLNFRFYARHDELNTVNLDETQNIKFQTQFRPTNRLVIDLTDVFTRVPIDDQLKTSPENPFENMTSVNIFRISPSYELPLTGTLSARLGYRYIYSWYDAEVSRDSESHAASASLTKLFSSGLNVSVNYDYMPLRSDESADYDRHEVSMNAGYQINQRLSVWGGFGMTFIEYDNNVRDGVTVDPYTGEEITGRFFDSIDNEDQSFWNAGASYFLDMFEGTELRVTYMESLSDSSTSQELWFENQQYFFRIRERELLFDLQLPTGEFILGSSSTTSGLTKLRRLDFQIKAGDHTKVRINPYYKIEESLEQLIFIQTGSLQRLKLSGKDKAKGISVTVSQPINLYDRVSSLSIGTSYERQKYDETSFDETIDRYSLGASLNFSLSESIGLSGGYQFTNRDSDIDENDFHNNVAWIEASVTF